MMTSREVITEALNEIPYGGLMNENEYAHFKLVAAVIVERLRKDAVERLRVTDIDGLSIQGIVNVVFGLCEEES